MWNNATSKRISSFSNNLVRAFVKHYVKELNTNRQWACPRKRKLRHNYIPQSARPRTSIEMDITLDFDCFYIGEASNPYKRPKSVILGNLSKNACV